MLQGLRQLSSYRHPILRSHQLARSVQQYATNSEASKATTSRIARLESRYPRLHRIIAPLRNAPVSHVTAFVILHEITAIVPLIGLAAFFHYSQWLPPYISEGKWVHQGMEKWGNYMRKKGWIENEKRGGRWWGRGEGGVRIVVEVATAWAVTKALLPLRLIFSVWATPWFARLTIVPLSNAIWRVFSRRKAVKTTPPPAAGTGAVGGGVLPQQTKTFTK